jgi:LuxR family transcriptional regulator, maltose regulon positive regulatory protein
VSSEPVVKSSRRRTPEVPLIESKLGVPSPRSAYLIRPPIDALLSELSQRALTIVTAPTGYGKTTALSGWARTTETQTAWISLDPTDNDPVRYLSYVVTAFARASGIRDAQLALRALRHSAADPIGSALPYLLNAVTRLTVPVVLVLDDYQRIENTTCHEATKALVAQSPEQLRIIISTRLDPPLPLGLLRARGELGEVRASELALSDDEAEQLLNGLLGLGLEPDLVQQLNRRTEGWAAGLYLAGLSLAAATDRRAFVEGFAGSNRHVVEYLATEVLAAQPDDVQQFLLQTSILDRLSAGLCDAVRRADDSSERLESLVATNLFLIPVHPAGEWFRYHRLFAELLRAELVRRYPLLVDFLHHRAAVWHEAEGHLEEAVYHALAAGEEELAARALAAHWRPFYQFGHHASLRRLLDQLPQHMVDGSAPLSFLAALLAGAQGSSEEVFEHHLQMVEQSGWEGPFPDGFQSVGAAVSFARMVYPYGDIARSLRAADRLWELVPYDEVLGTAARLGQARGLYLLGEHEAAEQVLPSDGRATALIRPLASPLAPALRSLVELEEGRLERALDLARAAAEVADEVGAAEVGTVGVVGIALGSALAAHGRLTEAEHVLQRAVEATAKPADILLSALARLRLARVRAARGRLAEARKLLVEAREIIESTAEPGILRAQLEELERVFCTRSRRDISFDDLPTESELRVLRLMASDVTRSEIATQLFLSPNTVKSHQRALYRKLGANTRKAAVARARELGLV